MWLGAGNIDLKKNITIISTHTKTRGDREHTASGMGHVLCRDELGVWLPMLSHTLYHVVRGDGPRIGVNIDFRGL